MRIIHGAQTHDRLRRRPGLVCTDTDPADNGVFDRAMSGVPTGFDIRAHRYTIERCYTRESYRKPVLAIAAHACTPRRAKVAETSANIFPLLPAPETASNVLLLVPPFLIDRAWNILRGEEGKDSIPWVYGIGIADESSPPVSRNIAFPRDLLLDFHYGSPPSLSLSLTLRSHALAYRLLRENDSGSSSSSRSSGTGISFPLEIVIIDR